MHKKSFFIFLAFLLLCLGGFKAQDTNPDESYTLKGQLLDQETSEEIPFAHITNLTLQLRTSSDSSGFFSIPAREGDSLQISSVTYGQQIIVSPAEPSHEKRLLVSLVPNVYELDEVVIRRFPSEYLLKQQMLGLELPKELGPNLRIPEGYFPKADPSATAAVGLGSPVSAIASQFSKKERGRAFAAKIKEQEARKAVISAKFNREIVKDIIKLEDEDQIDAFMKYCVLTDDFLFKASEYEIHDAVLGCFSEFMKEKG